MIARLPDNPNVVLVAIGSIGNLVGYVPSKNYPVDWMPSTLEGMKAIARASNSNKRYQSDEVVISDLPQELRELASEAVKNSVTMDPRDAIGQDRMELLAQVHFQEDRVPVFSAGTGAIQLDKVLLGAPI